MESVNCIALLFLSEVDGFTVLKTKKKSHPLIGFSILLLFSLLYYLPNNAKNYVIVCCILE